MNSESLQQKPGNGRFPLRIVLDQPRHSGNVGAVARAMRTMGFVDLHLVAPFNGCSVSHPDAIAFASRATDILADAPVHSTLPEALQGITLAYATSPKTHEHAPPPMTLAQAIDEALAMTLNGHRVAFVFGNERSGLGNEAVSHCQRLVFIETVDDYDSLNLAQSVMVTVHMARQAWLRATFPAPPLGEPKHAGETPASLDDIERLYQHLESALTQVGALDPNTPKFMMRRLRRLFSRSGLEVAEVQMLRGICAAMEKK